MLNTDSDSVDLCGGLRVCIFKKLPDEADAASPGTRPKGQPVSKTVNTLGCLELANPMCLRET